MPEGSLIEINGTLIPFEKGQKGDKVTGMKNQQQKILETMNYNYNGNLISIKAVGIPEFSLTPEHPILTIERVRDGNKKLCYSNIHKWKKCNELVSTFKKSDCLVFPKYKNYSNITEINLEEYHKLLTHKQRSLNKIPLNKSLMIICGLYVAEGWSTKTKNDMIVSWSLSKDETNTLAKDLQTALSEFGIYSTIRTHPSSENGINVICHSRQLGMFFKKEFGERAWKKRIPQFIMDANNENVEVFIKYAILGDGHLHEYEIPNQKLTFYCTTSPQLAFQFQKLLSKINLFGLLYRKKPSSSKMINGREIVGRHDVYTIILSNRHSEKLWNLDHKQYKNKCYDTIHETDEYFYLPIKKINLKKYNGKVYNYKTPDATFQINNVITHNSDHGFQKMTVCEFLRCTLSELRERIKNPADYFIILAYKGEKGERIRHEMEKVRR